MIHDDEPSGADPIASWKAALRAAPFHNWLDLDIVALSDERLELAMPWRDEIVSNPRIGSVHGGVLASLIDLAGFYVLLIHKHRITATATLSVDYHRPATAGPILASARIVKVGRRLCIAESTIRSAGGDVYASGRGVYLTGE